MYLKPLKPLLTANAFKGGQLRMSGKDKCICFYDVLIDVQTWRMKTWRRQITMCRKNWSTSSGPASARQCPKEFQLLRPWKVFDTVVTCGDLWWSVEGSVQFLQQQVQVRANAGLSFDERIEIAAKAFAVPAVTKKTTGVYYDFTPSFMNPMNFVTLDKANLVRTTYIKFELVVRLWIQHERHIWSILRQASDSCTTVMRV